MEVQKSDSTGPKELKLVFWSFLYFFVLLASYFILRPIRDEMGITNGASNMQWLFSGTFIGMLVIIPIFGYITSRFKIGFVLLFSYVFFIINILLFYHFFRQGLYYTILPIIFFIWLSIFNLFAISLFWSFMVDIFTVDQTKRFFGIISAGGSLGAILGPLITTTLSNELGIENLFLLAVGLLLLALLALRKLLQLQIQNNVTLKTSSNNFLNARLRTKNIFDSIRQVLASKYLQGIVVFIVLYTTVSTFLYFEQAQIIERTFNNSADRISYFSGIDLITNSTAIGGQFFLTTRAIRKFGLAITLCSIPILMGIGFIVLGMKTILPIVAILLVLHRTGNYILMRHGREMLYTVCNRGEKYRAKNFIDTAIYRGGDALSGWAFAGLISVGFGLSSIAILAVPFIALWAFIGFKLGRKQIKRQEKLHSSINATK